MKDYSAISTIGSTTSLRGQISGDGSLEIHGRVEGNISIEGDLLVAETAVLKSEIRVHRMIVKGTVVGNIFAKESLILEQGARVVGNFYSPQIGIRPGALVRGNVSTEDPKVLSGSVSSTTSKSLSSGNVSSTQNRFLSAPKPIEQSKKVFPSSTSKSIPQHSKEQASFSRKPEPAVQESSPPLPIVPNVKKGAKVTMKKKSA